MNELKFDDNLAIREVLDDIIAMVDRREKLIQSVRQKAEESGDQQMIQHSHKLQGLMSEFLALFEPILSKVVKYAETLQGSVAESEKFLKSLIGIISAGKNVDGGSATVQELERDAQGVNEELQLSLEELAKIKDLFSRTQEYAPKLREEKREEKHVEKPEDPLSFLTNEKPKRTRRSTSKPRVSRPHVLPRSSLSSDEPVKGQY
jgi:hypothetical protein